MAIIWGYLKIIMCLLSQKEKNLEVARAWESDLVPPSKKINIPCLFPAARKIKKVPPKIWAWFLLSTGHHYYKRKPHNKCILPYSSTCTLLQKSTNLTPILCFLRTLLPAELLCCNAFSSPGHVFCDMTTMFKKIWPLNLALVKKITKESPRPILQKKTLMFMKCSVKNAGV